MANDTMIDVCVCVCVRVRVHVRVAGRSCVLREGPMHDGAVGGALHVAGWRLAPARLLLPGIASSFSSLVVDPPSVSLE
jgi:hypothetical protein